MRRSSQEEDREQVGLEGGAKVNWWWEQRSGLSLNKDVNNLFCLNKNVNNLFFHNKEFECKTPCTKTVFTSKFMHSSRTKWKNRMALYVAFDKIVDITHSGFSINEQTLLVRLGKVFSIRAHLACQARRVSE